MKSLLLFVFTMIFLQGIALRPVIAQEDDDEAGSSSGKFFKGFEIQGGLELPTQIGVRGKFNFAHNFYTTAGVGYAPSFIINMNTGMANTFGTINSNDAKILDAALNNSFYVDIRLGWNFDSNEEGFFVEGGYSLMNGSGDKVNKQQVEAVTQKFYPTVPLNSTYDISSIIHNLTLSGGYNWVLWENWRLSVDVGIAKPLSSSTSISFDQNSFIYQSVNAQIESDLDSSISDLFSSYFIFKAGVWMGYIF